MNEEKLKVIEMKIGKIKLEEGDYLVFRFPDHADFKWLNNAENYLKNNFPDLAKRTIIMNSNVKIYVIHEDE